MSGSHSPLWYLARTRPPNIGKWAKMVVFRVIPHLARVLEVKFINIFSKSFEPQLPWCITLLKDMLNYNTIFRPNRVHLATVVHHVTETPYHQQGPPGDPFLPLTNDIAFPRNIASAETVYPGLNKSYNRHMIVLFCPSVRNAHSTHLKFKMETYTPKRVFLKLQISKIDFFCCCRFFYQREKKLTGLNNPTCTKIRIAYQNIPSSSILINKLNLNCNSIRVTHVFLRITLNIVLTDRTMHWTV